MDAARLMSRLRANPRQSIANARKSDLADLAALANFWQELGPPMLELGIIDAFFSNLDGDKVPDYSVSETTVTKAAFMALHGLSKIGNFIGDGEAHAAQIVAAWPGTFKWCSYFFATRVQEIRPVISEQHRKSVGDIICAMFYSISRSDSVREAIVATPDSIEIMTKLWLIEDTDPDVPSFGVPTGSAALAAMLRNATSATLDRVLYAAGGEADKIAKLSVSRLSTAIKNPASINSVHASMYADVINQLCRPAKHPLRNALLSANSITWTTKTALAASALINKSGDQSLLDPLVASFAYLRNCLESSDGFTWVVQSVNAGLLSAFVDSSPHYSKLEPEDREMILEIFSQVVPKYLVYRSVILAVDGAMAKVEKSAWRDRISDTAASKPWFNFRRLAHERLLVTHQAEATKGKALICDNVKCQKIQAKATFQQCAACLTTYYCSKNCQKEAWKEGDHRTMCKLKQQERLEGKMEAISRQDTAFFHALSTRDARKHLPKLRGIAAREHEGVPLANFVVCIDYTVLPETYTLRLLTEEPGPYSRQINGSANAEARNNALHDKAKKNPEKYVLIESTISNGRSDQLVLTLGTGEFWNGDVGLIGGDGRVQVVDEEDFGDYNTIDEVDIQMARSTLNGFLRSLGEPATF